MIKYPQIILIEELRLLSLKINACKQKVKDIESGEIQYLPKNAQLKEMDIYTIKLEIDKLQDQMVKIAREHQSRLEEGSF